MATLWLGLTPVVLTAAYYAAKKTSDFDPALKPLQTEKLIRALRVGSASCERPGLSINSTDFGVNADNPSFDRSLADVWDGLLYGTYQATYIGWFRGAHMPEVFTVSRSLARSGEISYSVWRNGPRPIANYLFWISLFGAFLIFFFEVVGIFQKKKKANRDYAT